VLFSKVGVEGYLGGVSAEAVLVMAFENLSFDWVSSLSVFPFSFAILSLQELPEMSDFLHGFLLLLLALLQLSSQSSVLFLDSLKLTLGILLITIVWILPGKAEGSIRWRQAIKK
jgi:hypothetical protein